MAQIKRIVERTRDGQVVSRQEFLRSHPRSLVSAKAGTVGLGDLVERFAKPIAHLLDAASERFLPAGWETHIGSCSACARRQRKLNLLCPDIERCPVLEKLLGFLTIGVRNKLMEAIRKSVARGPAGPPAG